MSDVMLIIVQISALRDEISHKEHIIASPRQVESGEDELLWFLFIKVSVTDFFGWITEECLQKYAGVYANITAITLVIYV